MDPSLLSGIGAVDFGLFIGGFGTGWAAAQRVSVKIANERIAELQKDLEKATERITMLEDQRYRDAREDAGKLDVDAKINQLVSRLSEKKPKRRKNDTEGDI